MFYTLNLEDDMANNATFKRTKTHQNISYFSLSLKVGDNLLTSPVHFAKLKIQSVITKLEIGTIGAVAGLSKIKIGVAYDNISNNFADYKIMDSLLGSDITLTAAGGVVVVDLGDKVIKMLSEIIPTASIASGTDSVVLYVVGDAALTTANTELRLNMWFHDAALK